MAITKVMHMKASSKARIDIHLEHSINYILQPKKLGEANLVGGINCLPDLAYQQMKATKQMFGKTGGRQGYHFVISLKPDEGRPEIMYDIAMRFAQEAFRGEYEALVAVHTDRNHLHAHIVINSVNMVTGYKFQYGNGDWKSFFSLLPTNSVMNMGFILLRLNTARSLRICQDHNGSVKKYFLNG